MKSEKKLRNEFYSIEKKFNIDPCLLAKANKFITFSDQKQMKSTISVDQQIIKNKYKKQKIAERALLSALDEIQIQYISKHRRIVIATQEIVKKIKHLQREIQNKLENLKQMQLDKIEPQIHKFMNQRKILKKMKSAKNLTVEKTDKLIDGHQIAERVKYFKVILQIFDKQIDEFCEKIKRIEKQLENSGKKNDENIKIISSHKYTQTFDEVTYNPDCQESFQKKLKQIRGIFHERKSHQKQIKNDYRQRNLQNGADLTKVIYQANKDDRIEVNHANNISLQQIFQKDSETLQQKFQRIHNFFIQQSINKDRIQSSQLKSKSSLFSQIPRYQIQQKKQCQEDLQSMFRQQLNKIDKSKNQSKHEKINEIYIRDKNKRTNIIDQRVNHNQQQFTDDKTQIMNKQKEDYKYQQKIGLKSVRSEQSLVGNTSTLSQKSASSRANCLEVLRLQKLKYQEIKNSLIR